MTDEFDKIWKKFLKNHWKMLVLWIVAAIVAGIGLIYVFLWLVGEAQVVGLVPELLGLWAMKHFIDFVLHLMNAPINKIAIENPIGCISTRIRKPDQYIQPYEFGEDASKKTCLWLKNLPKLKPTKYIEPRIINGKKRWANQTDSGQNRLGPSDDRWKKRSQTYRGLAQAMANQWK